MIKRILMMAVLAMGSHFCFSQSLDWSMGGTMEELDAMRIKYSKSDCGDFNSLVTDTDDSGMSTRYVFDKINNRCELIVWYFTNNETFEHFVYRLGTDRDFNTLVRGTRWHGLLNAKPTVFEVRPLTDEQVNSDFVGKIYVYRESNEK